MFKKSFLIVLILVTLVAVLPVQAQENDNQAYVFSVIENSTPQAFLDWANAHNDMTCTEVECEFVANDGIFEEKYGVYVFETTLDDPLGRGGSYITIYKEYIPQANSDNALTPLLKRSFVLFYVPNENTNQPGGDIAGLVSSSDAYGTVVFERHIVQLPDGSETSPTEPILYQSESAFQPLANLPGLYSVKFSEYVIVPGERSDAIATLWIPADGSAPTVEQYQAVSQKIVVEYSERLQWSDARVLWPFDTWNGYEYMNIYLANDISHTFEETFNEYENVEITIVDGAWLIGPLWVFDNGELIYAS